MAKLPTEAFYIVKVLNSALVQMCIDLATGNQITLNTSVNILNTYFVFVS